MEFEDLKGIGEKTANKLREAGFTLDNIKEVSVDDLIGKTGIQMSLAENIMSIIHNLPSDEEETDISSNSKKQPSIIKHDISNAKEHLIRAFEKSEYFDEENKKKAYNEWFEHLLKKNNRLRK